MFLKDVRVSSVMNVFPNMQATLLTFSDLSECWLKCYHSLLTFNLLCF